MDSKGILLALESEFTSLGLFETVNKHEVKSAPGRGLTCDIWSQKTKPVPRRSGLNTTSALLLFNARIYMNMLHEPQDEIDLNLLNAVDTIFNTLSGDFTLSGQVAEVDLLGNYGFALESNHGYLTIDNFKYRVYVIQIPLIINNAWSQSP